MRTYMEFKDKEYICPNCGWQGIGYRAQSCGLTDIHGINGIDVICPKCYEYLDTRAMPTLEERINLGDSEEEAKRIHGSISELTAERVNFYNSLPDIEDDEIIITLHEESASSGSFEGEVVLSWKGKEFWREERGFEYFSSYIDYGIYLKKKYGKRLIDFECEYTWALIGDSSRAFYEVRNFRKSLSNRRHMSNAEFGFVTKSDEFSKYTANYWKAIEFAKERHAGQTRDEGTPYFDHILGVVEVLRKHGHISDYFFTIAVLHDVLEDTETTNEELYELLRKVPSQHTIQEFMSAYDCDESKAVEIYDNLNNSDARDIVAEVELLTHRDGASRKEYIKRIFDDNSIQRAGGFLGRRENAAKYVKLADRIHNLSTISLCGNPEKIQRKVRETEKLIMPWRDKHAKCESLFAQIEEQLEELERMYRHGGSFKRWIKKHLWNF